MHQINIFIQNWKIQCLKKKKGLMVTSPKWFNPQFHVTFSATPYIYSDHTVEGKQRVHMQCVGRNCIIPYIRFHEALLWDFFWFVISTSAVISITRLIPSLASLQIQTCNPLIETIIRRICYHIPIHLQMPNHTRILTLCVVHIQREVLHS